jgi:thiol:disulfide interchange protein DsbD
MKIKLYLLALSCLLMALIGTHSSFASESEPVDSGRAQVQLVTSYDQVEPGQDLYIALSFQLERHWHTYWRNAGGPGMPVDIDWDMPATVSIGDMVWSLPQIVKTGPIVNYAFEDRLLIPMPLHIADTAKPGDVITINAEAAFLVCYEVCLPESAEISVSVLVGTPQKDNRWHGNIARTLKKAPKPNPDYKAGAALENGQLILDIAWPEYDAKTVKNAYFFPYIQDTSDADNDPHVSEGTTGLRLALTPGYLLDDGIVQDIEGVLAFDQKGDNGWQKTTIVVTASRTEMPAIGLSSSASTSKANGASIGLLAAVLGAFLGGMVLNLMPCVFPVLSLKALGFAKQSHDERGKIRFHGWMYTLGAVLSFLFLAALLLVLKASGAGLGWGFQLQNPIVVGGLALLFFAIALNLFGLFELGGSFQNTGSDLTQKDGASGTFFTGVLAVVVATPCTAPFMASALGFAFAQPAIITLLVFLALGVGFALPFLILSHAPGLLKRLPKPGAWMDTFKQFLAFPMLATSIWLTWVLTHLSGADGGARILLAMLMAGFGIWLLKRSSTFAKILAAASLICSIYLVATLNFAPIETSSANAQTEQKWSSEAVAALRAQGHPVFVDFTASWCVTCKVNERLVLDTQKTKDLFARTNTKVLVADWTRKDAVIAAELARHGRSGVPLYLVYPAGTTPVDPQILPQTLSSGVMQRAIEAAQQSSTD